MFEATHLGHQSWLIESGPTRLLVDPVLNDHLMPGTHHAIEIYPPRQIDLSALPPIDGVLITHEHPDHFNLPTLALLEPGTRVFLPRRSSMAAKSLLAELGHDVTLLRPGEAITLGELELHPWHSSEITRDEWDVLPFVVRDRDGHGSLATAIDAPDALDFARFAAERTGKVGIWLFSHSHLDLSVLRDDGRQDEDELVTRILVDTVRERVETWFDDASRPEVLAVLCSGFRLTGQLDWLNQHLFPGHADDLARLVEPELPSVKVRAPVPGHRLSMRDGKLVDEIFGRPFLTALDREHWPPHAARPLTGGKPDFGPLDPDARTLDEKQLTELVDELGSFAGQLYGGALMRVQYASVHPAQVGLALRNGEETLALAWRPDACAFVLLEDVNPREAFDLGLECWASDLLAVLRLEISAGNLTLGLSRTWQRGSWGNLESALLDELSLHTHALRQPARTLARYREAIADLRAAGAGEGTRIRRA